MTTKISLKDNKIIPKHITNGVIFDKKLSEKVKAKRTEVLLSRSSAEITAHTLVPSFQELGDQHSHRRGKNGKTQTTKYQNTFRSGNLNFASGEVSSSGVHHQSETSFENKQPINMLDLSISEHKAILPNQRLVIPTQQEKRNKSPDEYNVPRSSSRRFFTQRGYGLQTGMKLPSMGSTRNSYASNLASLANNPTLQHMMNRRSTLGNWRISGELPVSDNRDTYLEAFKRLNNSAAQEFNKLRTLDYSFDQDAQEIQLVLGGTNSAVSETGEYVSHVGTAVEKFRPSTLKRLALLTQAVPKTSYVGPMSRGTLTNTQLLVHRNPQTYAYPDGVRGESLGQVEHVSVAHQTKAYRAMKGEALSGVSLPKLAQTHSKSSLYHTPSDKIVASHGTGWCLCAHPRYGLSTVCDGHVDKEYFHMLQRTTIHGNKTSTIDRVVDTDTEVREEPDQKGLPVFRAARRSPPPVADTQQSTPTSVPFKIGGVPLTVRVACRHLSDFYERTTEEDAKRAEQDARRRKLRELFLKVGGGNNTEGWRRGSRLQQTFQDGIRMMMGDKDLSGALSSIKESSGTSGGRRSSPNSPTKTTNRKRMEEMRLKILLQEEADAKAREKKKEKWTEMERLRIQQKQREYDRIQRGNLHLKLGLLKKQEYLEKKKTMDVSRMNSSRNEDIQLPGEDGQTDHERMNQTEDSKYLSVDGRSSQRAGKVSFQLTQLVPSSMLDPNFLFLSPEKSNFLMKSMRGIASRRGSIYQKYSKSKMSSQMEILDPSSFKGGSQRRQSRFEVLTDRIEDGDPNFPDPLHLHSNCLDYDENKVSLESRKPTMRKSSEDGTMVYKSYWLNVINKLLGYFDLKRVEKVGYFEKLEIEPQIEIDHGDYNFLPERMKLAYEQEFLMLGMLIEDINIDEDILALHILKQKPAEAGDDMWTEGESSPTPTPFGSPVIVCFPEPDLDLDVDTPYEMDWETTDIKYIEKLYAPNRIKHPDED